MLATDLGKRLGWRTWVPSLEDSTPQTGKVTRRVAGGGVKQVDFLSGVAGLTTKDLARRAVELDIPDIGRLRVIHPIDVLDSRIQNLHLLPGKRTEAGIAQARLAVDVARAFIGREVRERGERVGLKLLERVAEMAADIAEVRVCLLYGIDPLAAVPLPDFRTTTALHKVRWPRIVAEVTIRAPVEPVALALPSRGLCGQCAASWRRALHEPAKWRCRRRIETQNGDSAAELLTASIAAPYL